ncbi:uncharacterized protein TNCV_1528871 [Trichonephila clavipes]|uniref:Transposase n=1 Tax=Trichonephila clavipes TaxID=2585209 RepID=A0A8X6VLD4_TRICX|nr:uncharacterized protein TNCV_1528871 [Trichonephila clavipes]
MSRSMPRSSAYWPAAARAIAVIYIPNMKTQRSAMSLKRLLPDTGLRVIRTQVAAVAEWYRYRTVACFVTGSSPVPLKTRRVGQRCTLNLSRAETSSRVGVVVRRGGCQLSCQVIYSQFGLAIHQNDHQARCRFVEWAQNEIAVVPDFHKRILFSDEAHFWLNGYVNKQNCRIWSEANPQVYVETPLHPEKLTVWCALWAGGIIGPYFFKNDEGHNVTVNRDRYRAMITNFFIPELNNHDVQELWF